MKKKTITKISLLSNTLLFLCVGLFLCLIPEMSLKLFHLSISLLLVGLGSLTLILNIINAKKIQDILISLSTLFIGVFFYNNQMRFLSLFPIIFGIYMLINGIIKFWTYWLYKNQRQNWTFNVLLSSLLDFIFAFITISQPSNNLHNLTIILGIYLMFFAINYAFDFLRVSFPKKFIKENKRRFRITLPIIISTLIPYRALVKLNKTIDKYIANVQIDKKLANENADIEIFIHISDKNWGRFGHVDFYFEGIVYSYGCYDSNSKKFYETMGDGVLFEVENKSKYINFCKEDSKKTIFAFGMALTEKQKTKIRNEIEKIKEATYKWDCSYETDKGSHHQDYASRLYKATKAKFYKFSKTTYKTYFLFFTNCVKLVDNVLGSIGSDLLKINGIITPGVYYDYLEKEFKRENSNVISKAIYSYNKKK